MHVHTFKTGLEDLITSVIEIISLYWAYSGTCLHPVAAYRPTISGSNKEVFVIKMFCHLEREPCGYNREV